ncbi:MAG TPA: type IV pili twitching motility protein PilT [Myxococcales bacterium]|nr:type IV pili twitching motility protein PilT [Myxococcales bacterium]
MSARLDTFLRIAADQQASDLHFHAGKVPMIRHHGELSSMPFRVLSAPQVRTFLEEILSPAQRAKLDAEQQVDFAYDLDGVGRFRASVCEQNGGLSAVFRVIPDGIPNLSDLELPAAVAGFTRHANGLVLITGPTGSGKTTTLAAMVDLINRTSGRHVITVEDPIEFVHEPKRGLVTQREIGLHAASFASALRSALREAPDVLVVGEMRDFETISLALTAAEAGVLVFTTLHTGSAAKALDRMMGAAPADQQEQVREVLSVLLRGVLSQRLCRLANGQGRAAAPEILLQSISISHLIREQKVHQIDAYLRGGEHSAHGMVSLEQSLVRLVREGRITRAEALLHANDAEAVTLALTKAGAA